MGRKNRQEAQLDLDLEMKLFQHPLLQDLDPFEPPPPSRGYSGGGLSSEEEEDLWDVFHIFPSSDEKDNSGGNSSTTISRVIQGSKEQGLDEEYNYPERAWWIKEFTSEDFTSINVNSMDIVQFVQDVLTERGSGITTDPEAVEVSNGKPAHSYGPLRHYSYAHELSES